MSQDKRKIKIAFFSHMSEWGGAQKCLYLLLEGLDHQRFEPLVFVPDEGEVKERIEKLGIRTLAIKLPQWMNMGDQFCDNLQERINHLTSIFSEENIDIVFSNTSVIGDGAIAAKLLGIPHVWHVLEILGDDPVLEPFLDLPSFFSIMDHLSYRIVAVSKAVEDNILKYNNAAKTTVINTGLSLSQEYPQITNKRDHLSISPDTHMVCFAGVLSIRKGVLTLIDSIPEVISHIPNTRFVFVGPHAGLEEEINEKVTRLQIEDHVSFLGYRNDVLDIIYSSDLVVLSSTSDPLPVVVLEAMALSKPVVATRSGGTVDMVVDNDTGRLVPVGEPNPMAKAIQAILQQPDRGQEMGRRGYERLLRLFSPEGYVRAFQDLFLEMVSQSSSSDALNLNQHSASSCVPLLPILLSRSVKAYHLEAKVDTLEKSNRSLQHRLDRIRNSPPMAIIRKLSSLVKRQ